MDIIKQGGHYRFAVTAPWTHLQGIFLGMVLG